MKLGACAPSDPALDERRDILQLRRNQQTILERQDRVMLLGETDYRLQG